MDIKSVISNVVLLAISFLAVSQISRYYFGNGSRQDQEIGSGQKLSAPKAVVQTPELHQPLNTEIDFLDKKVDRPEVTTLIETPLMQVAFSNDGAIATGITFKRIQASVAHNLNTFSLENPEMQREQGAFLVAFNERTPYYYDLVENREEDDAHLLTYAVKTEGASVTKQFKVYKNKHQIDLNLSIQGEGIQPRIFVPAPLLENSKRDEVRALINNPKNQVQKETVDLKLVENFWASPTIFGAEDRYFIHAMVRDSNNFAMRGFYTFDGENRVSTIIESMPLKSAEQTNWLLSFYMGPKEIEAFNAVDSRLDTTLEYGFWAPVSKILLKSMKFMYDYIPNYGLVIILLTLFIKLLLLPFSFKQNAVMKSRKELDRKIAYLESKYKNDRETLMKEKAEVIRKHGMPGMLGCLPLFVQMPFFIALNRVLNNSIELFQAPFLWINDLSAADPFYILPLLLMLGMVITLAAAGDIRQRLPFFLMALIFGAIAANWSAGLSLFIATSVWLSIAETRLKKVAKA